MHQAGRALLASKDVEVRTHKGTIARLREVFGDALGPDRLRTLARMQDLRQRSDYDVAGDVTEEEAVQAVVEAEAFLVKAHALLEARDTARG